ncbi:glycosyltransferase [Alkalimonas amylolytica]|uniref:Glycosyltransferase involved in cell wall bisynthesis n=1 Tax=Alkalimonas amylolytica TaxID=152573 RepID=A0A1H3Y9T6_ALKAM|nr:glycosyltransferase [Alkalimonas amylolytica]SEA08326.1 Glycosyltransferase involved in cell wall bisynthesis [Alkalimonas amylolytica]
MKIVHLILTTRFAGSERYAVELANAQAEQHEVYLILRKVAAEQRPDAIAHRVSQNVRIMLVHDFALFSHFQIRALLKKIQPDVAHAHLSRGCRALASLPASAMLRTATLHIHYKPQQHAKLDALIAIAPAQLDTLPATLRKHSCHLDNWTHALPVDRQQGLLLRQQHQIPDQHLVLGSLGRVEASKGTETLIKAFLNTRLDNTTLVIVGQGKDWSVLQQKYGQQPNLRLVGFSEQPQAWLAGFDCFVSAARSEPFGLVFLEAMVAGLPIIATKTQGACHLADYFPYPLVEVDDEAGLGAALHHFAEKPLPRLQYDMLAFNYEAQVAKVEQFYQQQRARLAEVRGGKALPG